MSMYPFYNVVRIVCTKEKWNWYSFSMWTGTYDATNGYYCKKKLKHLRPTAWPALLWLVISTVLLLIPGSAFPKDDWLGKIWFDKWVHAGMFAVMVFLWCWSMTGHNTDASKWKTGFTLIAILALAYGIGMEFAQKYFVANRSFDSGDILADAGGCILGWFVSVGRFIKK